MCGCNQQVPETTTQVSRTMTNNAVRPTVEQMNEAQPFLQMVAAANPDAVKNVLESKGYNTQGMSSEAMGAFMYRMYAAGQFDINALNGILVASQVNGRVAMANSRTIFDDNETVGDWVGDIGGLIGTVFGTGSGINNTQAPAPDNSDLIAGMQRSTMYMIVGIMVIVIGLIVFLAFRKK